MNVIHEDSDKTARDSGHSKPTPGRHVLAINAGSSSLKAALYRTGGGETLVLAFDFERLGSAGSFVRITDAEGKLIAERSGKLPDFQSALRALFAALTEFGDFSLAAVGHRIVHGGLRYCQPERITPEVVVALRKLEPLAPDHMPHALHSIEFVGSAYPALLQVACFDTMFHRSMPRVAQMIALPRRLQDEGLVRFGFHGLSYEFITSELRRLDPAAAAGRVIVAHLGNGASMTAIRNGQSIDTTMGFTPNSGLVMGTRSGDVDPGVLTYLLEHRGRTPQAVDALLNDRSGLLGISGQSRDMRDLLGVESTNSRAADAIELFCYRSKKYLGAFASVLGGLDTLVFTGGIGGNAPAVRERICAGQEFLGITLDAASNLANAAVISVPGSAVTVRVMRTDEELMIVRDTVALLTPGRDQRAAEGSDVH